MFYNKVRLPTSDDQTIVEMKNFPCSSAHRTKESSTMTRRILPWWQHQTKCEWETKFLVWWNENENEIESDSEVLNDDFVCLLRLLCWCKDCHIKIIRSEKNVVRRQRRETLCVAGEWLCRKYIWKFRFLKGLIHTTWTTNNNIHDESRFSLDVAFMMQERNFSVIRRH